MHQLVFFLKNVFIKIKLEFFEKCEKLCLDFYINGKKTNPTNTFNSNKYLEEWQKVDRHFFLVF